MHRSMTPAAMVGAILIALTACDFDSTEPDVSFTNDRVPATDTVSVADVFGSGGGLLVGGTITAPSTCYGLKPKLSQGRGSITITVHAEIAVSSCSNTDLSAYSYSLITTGYSAGIYQVKVVHTLENNAFPAKTVFDQQVTIN